MVLRAEYDDSSASAAVRKLAGLADMGVCCWRKLANELALLEDGMEAIEVMDAVDVDVGKPILDWKLKSALGRSAAGWDGPDEEGPICSHGSEPSPPRPMVAFHSRFFPDGVVEGGGMLDRSSASEGSGSSKEEGGGRLRGCRGPRRRRLEGMP